MSYNPVIFSKKFLNKFYDLEGDIGGKQIIKKIMMMLYIYIYIYIDFDDEKEFQDIDTPKDFLKIENQ